MKLITAIIKDCQLDSVCEAVQKLGVPSVETSEIATVSDTGRDPRTKIEFIVLDDLFERAVEAVLLHANTGKIGAGKLWVTDPSLLVRIRTDEKCRRGDCGDYEYAHKGDID